MKFVYKIYSGYDGFTPQMIEERMLPGRLLKVGWDRYTDQAEKGDGVWVYFHGPKVFDKGVYAKCTIRKIDLNRRFVLLKVNSFTTSHPLTIDRTTEKIADLVAARHGIQVFPVPAEWQPRPKCTALTTGDSCQERRCEWCSMLERVPLALKYNIPERLINPVIAFIAGYWVIPRRHPAFSRQAVKPPIRWVSDLFNAFKSGSEALAYPLSLGLYRALKREDYLEFAGIVPVPLSPDKKKRGELHRTLAIANELSQLLDCPVYESLELEAPISKRRYLSRGGTIGSFEVDYRHSLRVKELPQNGRILVVDDTATKGSTLNACVGALSDKGKEDIVAGVATLMITKAVTRNATEYLT